MSQTDPQSPPSSSPQTAPGRPTLPVNSRSASDVLAEMQAMRSRDARKKAKVVKLNEPVLEENEEAKKN